MNRIKPVFVMVLSNREVSENFEMPPGQTSPIGIPTAETGSLKEIYSPSNPWAKPPFVDSVLLQDLVSSHNYGCFGETDYSSSNSASSYKRSNFLPSGLRLEITVICLFFLFTL